LGGLATAAGRQPQQARYGEGITVTRGGEVRVLLSVGRRRQRATAAVLLLLVVAVLGPVARASASPHAVAQSAGGKPPPPFWDRLSQKIAADEAEVPGAGADTDCPDRGNFLAAADTLLTGAQLRGKDLQILQQAIASIYARTKEAGLPTLTATTASNVKAVFHPLVRLLGPATMSKNLDPESSTLSDLRLDLRLTGQYIALNNRLIAKLAAAQKQLEQTSPHCD
jgi:hypothetical protein